MNNAISARLRLLSSQAGSYALIMRCQTPVKVSVGSLGETLFPAGLYMYFGSAKGAGGLKARIGRHLQGRGAVHHWHIDYLMPWVIPIAFCYLVEQTTKPALKPQTSDRPKPVECTWSQAAADLPGAQFPLQGFGASDCRFGCVAHLVGFRTRSDMRVSGKTDSPVEIVETFLQNIALPETNLVYV